MVAIEDLRTEFEAIGIDPGQDVLLKCKYLIMVDRQ